jgi:hypothetical protein
MIVFDPITKTFVAPASATAVGEIDEVSAASAVALAMEPPSERSTRRRAERQARDARTAAARSRAEASRTRFVAQRRQFRMIPPRLDAPRVARRPVQTARRGHHPRARRTTRVRFARAVRAGPEGPPGPPQRQANDGAGGAS